MTSTSNTLNDDLKERIKSTLKEIVVQEHSAPNKQLLKGMSGRIVLACPYCGDSHDDDTKKRGNLYWDTLQYHCYNCGEHTNIHKMAKDFGIRLGQSQDTFNVIDYIQSNKSKVKQADTLKHDILKQLNEIAINVDEFKKFAHAKEIQPGEWIWFKLKERLLHNRADEFLYSDKTKKLWILNFGANGNIIGVQSRRMKGYGQRYLTYDIGKLYEEMKKEHGLEPDILARVNKASTLFGIMQLNFQRAVTIFEGPLDAKFMRNSLALATAGRSTEEFDEMATVRYMFDNDKTGKQKMIEKLKKGRPVFMWQKFLQDFKLDIYNIKDLNDVMLKCYELKIDAHKKINDYFTSSKLDLWYI